MVPTASASGSGPRAWLVRSKVLLSSGTLKKAGTAAAVIRSKASPVSASSSPRVVQIASERPPKA